MKDKIIFVSSLCPDCKEIIKDYEENQDKYQDFEFIDITKSMKNLKTYLSCRDNLVDFDRVKRLGTVGVPSKLDHGKLTLL